MAVKTPVPAEMVKAETFPPPFAVYRNCPFGDTTTPRGLVPAENGEPAAMVSTPVALLIVKAATDPPWFAT